MAEVGVVLVAAVADKLAVSAPTTPRGRLLTRGHDGPVGVIGWPVGVGHH